MKTLNEMIRLENIAFNEMQATLTLLDMTKKQISMAGAKLRTEYESLFIAREWMNKVQEQLRRQRLEREHARKEQSYSKKSKKRKLDRLRKDAIFIGREMRDYFNRAVRAYNCGDRAMMEKFSEAGHKCEFELYDLNNKINALSQDLKGTDWTYEGDIIDPSKFCSARAEYKRIKKICERAEQNYELLIIKQKRLYNELDDQRKDYERIKTERKFMQAKQVRRLYSY